MSQDIVYLLCKQIFTETALIKCEFDDDNTIISCGGCDTPFEIKFTKDRLVDPSVKTQYRFLIHTGYVSRLKLESPGLFTAQINYMLAIIYKNLNDKAYTFNTRISEVDRGIGNVYEYVVEHMFFKGTAKTYKNHQLYEKHDEDNMFNNPRGIVRKDGYIQRYRLFLDYEDDEFIFDNETTIKDLMNWWGYIDPRPRIHKNLS